ncbi:DUF4126 domain-containing protein [Desulfonema magnum]|uniref:Uncharacterized protein n=1 Tax=Desulfonema magnum TaxID=45655 RepID=A0A975BP52_9BACT|nr:DUF4126 domain-containing protein [Desulfonema magnum]QTA88510.1 Uncharacterized protein dnm_045560 [Desulfonema magnum]
MKEEESKATIQIEVNTERIIRSLVIFCIAFEIFLVLLDGFINYGEYIDIRAIQRFCNIAREDSLASWFGTTQTLMVGLTLWLIVWIVRHTSASKKTTLGWSVIASFFTYMAVDDGAEIHERMGTAFETMAKAARSAGDSSSWMAKLLDIFPSYPWQVLFLPLFGLMGLFIVIFLWRELNWKRPRVLIILALTCFVIAVGFDFIEGLDKKHTWNIHTLIRHEYGLKKYTVRHFSKSAEEFIEMMGTTLFWLAFLSYLEVLTRRGVHFFPKHRLQPSDKKKNTHP